MDTTRKVTMKVANAVLVCVMLFGPSGDALGQNGKEAVMTKPDLHHILIEVKDIKESLRFYRDCLGLAVTSQTGDFATVESANAGVYLSQNRWSWEKPCARGDCNGAGLYPHFEVPDIAAAIGRFKAAGYAIIQSPKSYDWGKEAFVQDADGYVIALVTMAKRN
jgi:predicted enzyme related to lactoylglutathione lyase